MKKFPLLALLLTLGFLISTVSAQQEYDYDDNLWVDAGAYRDQMAQHSPRVACNPNAEAESCVIVYYFSGDGSGGATLALRYTWDNFESISSPLLFPISVDYNTPNLTGTAFGNYALPYDVTWYNNQYWIVFKSSGAGLSYIFTWDTTNGFVQKATRPVHYHCPEIIDEYTNEPKFICIHHSQSSNTVYYDELYLVNNTVHIGNVAIGSASCFSVGIDYIFTRGFWEKAGTTNRHSVDGFYKCGAGAWTYGYSSADLGTFNPSGYDGIWYWDGTRLFFRTATSVRYQSTSDLTSFGDVVEYHTFDTSYAEVINYTDGDFTSLSTYVFRAETNLTARSFPFPFEYKRGNFASQQSLNKLRIAFMTATNTYSINIPFNYTAILSCDEYDYTVQDSGLSTQVMDLVTPCDDNTLTLINTEVQPLTTSVDIEFTSTCSNYEFDGTNSFFKPYSLEIRTRDVLFSEPVAGVLVTIGDESNTTNSQGITYIPDYTPFVSSFFELTGVACRIEPLFNATIQPAQVLATKSDYNLYSQTAILASYPLGAYLFENVENDFLVEMIPPSAYTTVRVLTSDNVEVESTSSQVAVAAYGANTTYVVQEGNYYEQNIVEQIPADFYLVDNRTSWSANFTLEFYGSYYQQNATVQKNQQQIITFHVDEKSTELPCESNLDCPASFCSDRYFKQLHGCVAGTCEYDTSSCRSDTLCDTTRGCFDALGIDTCEDDYDCTNETFCLSSKKSRVGMCGVLGVCIYKDMTCRNDCNQTTGRCAETDLCLELGQLRDRFLIQAYTQPIFAIENQNIVDVDYACGIANRGERRCIRGGSVPISEFSIVTGLNELVGVVTLPDSWQYTTNQTHALYSDISIMCSNLCNVTYSYCQYGCNDETGFCQQSPTSPEGSVSNIISLYSAWWYLFFPTILEQSMAWVFVMLIVSGVVSYAVGKNGSGNNGLIFLGSMIALALAGMGMGFVPLFMGITFIVIGGYLVLKMWRGV